MTTTYDEESNPIENGVQQVYTEIRDSLSLILGAEGIVLNSQSILISLDDAISNNWDDLMSSFWQGVKQDIPES